MVLLVMTIRLSNILQKVRRIKGGLPDQMFAPCGGMTKEDTPSLEDLSPGKPIAHNQILQLHKLLHSIDPNASPSIDDLLQGTSVYFPKSTAQTEQTPEYLALMKSLRDEQEQREYERMIYAPSSPISPTSPTSMLFPDSIAPARTYPEDAISMQEINSQISLIINVLVSIIFSAIAVWLVAYSFCTPVRLGLSLMSALVVALAEVGVYFGYLQKVVEARKTERKRRERKSVIRRHSLGGNSLLDDSPRGSTTQSRRAEGGGRVKQRSRGHRRDTSLRE